MCVMFPVYLCLCVRVCVCGSHICVMFPVCECVCMRARVCFSVCVMLWTCVVVYVCCKHACVRASVVYNPPYQYNPPFKYLLDRGLQKGCPLPFTVRYTLGARLMHVGTRAVHTNTYLIEACKRCAGCRLPPCTPTFWLRSPLSEVRSFSSNIAS